MAKIQQIQIAFDFGEPLKPPANVYANEETESQNSSIQNKTEQKIEEVELINVVEEPIVNITPVEVPEIISITIPKTILTDPIVKKQKNTKSVRGRKSIKDMEADALHINIPSDEELYTKQYYPMSIVTQMFNVNHSLLRYWESEFAILQPRKNKKGDRLFRPDDIKNLEIIYKLLRVKKYTIEGAKDYFKNQKLVAKKYEAIQQLENLKSFLHTIKANLG